jgi:hypothetical protein
MDIAAQVALQDFRKDGTPSNAAALVAALDRAGLMPDSPREARPVQPVTFEPQGANVAHVATDAGRGVLSYGTLVGFAPWGSGPVYVIDSNPSRTSAKHLNQWLRPYGSRPIVKVAGSVLEHALRLVPADPAALSRTQEG